MTLNDNIMAWCTQDLEKQQEYKLKLAKEVPNKGLSADLN